MNPRPGPESGPVPGLGKALLGGFHQGCPQKFLIFLTTPPVRKFMQPPLLRLLTMSAFEGTPLPPQCGRPKWKPPPLEQTAALYPVSSVMQI